MGTAAPSLFGPASAVETTHVLGPGVSDALSELDGDDTVDLIVTFGPETNQDELVTEHGLTTLVDLESFPVQFVRGTAAGFWSLAGADGVTGIELNEPYEYHLETATTATRVTEVRETGVVLTGAPGKKTGEPVTFDGTGVGIAIVDSGVDATHPDLADRIVPGRNLRHLTPGLGSNAYADVPNSDEGGHGTHVAGIALGDGTASDGFVTGAAPGARLYAYGHGGGIFIFNSLVAWDHILANPSEPGAPEILVVSNSFGGAGAIGAAENTAINALVASGKTVVFSAGNDFDSGPGTDNVNRLCKAHVGGVPTEGVICVASYSDAEIGTTEGGISSFSSRDDTASTLDIDIAAPGQDILSTKASTMSFFATPAFATKYGETRVRDLPWYVHISGTSMAAPHVAGIVALIQQASLEKDGVTLTPAAVEAAIEESAHEFATYEAFPNRHAGSGLVDALAAIETGLARPVTAMDPGLQVRANAYSGIVFSGTGVLLNLGAIGSTGNNVADLEGFGQPFGSTLPDTNVLTPGASAISLRAFFTDAGGTELGTVQAAATVNATVTYLSSGTTFATNLTFTGSFWDGPGSFPYVLGVDGDVQVDFAFDVQGDGTFDPRGDEAVSVLYDDGL